MKGEKKASEIPYETIEEAALYVNTAVSENLGIEIPEALLAEASEVFEEISQ